tara:strand:- start:765 stop:1100 length:336 start_codon:yes stop_codon:yes gene_type:complete
VSSAEEGGEWNPLDAVNIKRKVRGLKPLKEDPRLRSLAKKLSNVRARLNIRGHIRGWQAGHATAEGVGYDASSDLKGKEFRSCCMYEGKWTFAGVGISVSRHGTFYTIMVR